MEENSPIIFTKRRQEHLSWDTKAISTGDDFCSLLTDSEMKPFLDNCPIFLILKDVSLVRFSYEDLPELTSVNLVIVFIRQIIW